MCAKTGNQMIRWFVFQTHKTFKRTLFIGTNNNMQIFGVIPFIQLNALINDQLYKALLTIAVTLVSGFNLCFALIVLRPLGVPGFGLFHCFGIRHQTFGDVCQNSESIDDLCFAIKVLRPGWAGFSGFGLFYCFGVHHQTLGDVCQSTESNNKMIVFRKCFMTLV